jgi:hypothetical protein
MIRLHCISSPFRERATGDSLQAAAGSDDQYPVSVNEDVMRDALLRSTPEDLDDVLTTAEVYRMCMDAARKLESLRGLEQQRRQLVECARACESALAAFAETGCVSPLRHPDAAPDWPDVIYVRKW